MVGYGAKSAGGQGNRRSAASGGCSEAISMKCPDWRTRQWPSVGWHDGRQENPAPTGGNKECGKTGRRGRRPLRRGHMKRLRAGRCGERTERCQWQKQRSERVAAVKISSVRRKAAQKFWAPQQGHRPLRNRIMGCVGEGLCPSHGRGRTPPLRKRYKKCGWRVVRDADPYDIIPVFSPPLSIFPLTTVKKSV